MQVVARMPEGGTWDASPTLEERVGVLTRSRMAPSRVSCSSPIAGGYIGHFLSDN